MTRARGALVPLLVAAVACSGGRGDPIATPAPPAPRASPPATASPSPTLRPVSRAPCGDDDARREVRFRVSVSERLRAETTTREFARTVRSILCDERSWIASGAVRFRYDSAAPLLIGLRTPGEAQRRCLALINQSVNRTYSCGHPREVVINSDRWLTGAPPGNWPGPLRDYRRMLMNHEVGHALLLHHESCPRDGARAPVMMQQSKGLRSPNGRTCRRNPWPLPHELAKLR